MQRHTVLIVDDIEDNIKILANYLKPQGYKIAFSTKGAEALKMVERKKVDLILLDILMPEMDGLEVCERLKSSSDTREIPVIFLSAKTDTDSIVRGFELGASDYIPKPFNQIELLARIRTQLELVEKSNALKAANLDLERVVDHRTKELQKTNEWLRESEQNLIEAQKLARLGHWQYDVNTKELKWADELFPIFGMKKGSITPATVEKRVHPDDLKTRFVPYDQFSKECKTETQYKIVTEDGETRSVFQIGEPKTDASGKVLKIVGFKQDVTERVQAESALRLSEEKYRSIFEQALDSIFLVDLQTGAFTEFNQQSHMGLGYTEEEYRKLKIRDIEGGVDCKKISDYLKKEGSLQESFETRHKKKNGEEVDMLVRIHPITIGKTRYLQAICRDITQQKIFEKEQKRLENQLQQAEKLKAVGTFAEGIAHDFNNVLQGMMFSVGRLKTMEDEHFKRELPEIEKIDRGIMRAKNLIRQIQMFSQNEQLEKVAFQIGPIMSEVASMLRDMCSVGVRIEEEVRVDNDWAMGNPDQIFQVLFNLGINAKNALAKKPGSIRFVVGRVEVKQKRADFPIAKPGDYLLMEVRDDGCGIPDEISDRIFEPFFTTKLQEDSSGLGLSVVHGIVESHKGVIEVESKLGIGTTFKIFLPMAKTRGKTQLQAKSQKQTQKTNRVLLVDDEVDALESLKQSLEERGYRVEATNLPQKALELLEQSPQDFDIVVSDYAMPSINGMRLLKRIRENGFKLPFVLITGNPKALTKELDASISIDSVLTKPVSGEQLFESLNGLLENNSKIQS